jgi:hypothetical protein
LSWLPAPMTLKMPSDGVELQAHAARLAAAIIRKESIDHPHWSDSARMLLECLILYVCTEPDEERSLARVHKLLFSRSPVLMGIFQVMASSAYKPLARKAVRFVDFTTEVSTVVATARTQWNDFDEPWVLREV